MSIYRREKDQVRIKTLGGDLARGSNGQWSPRYYKNQ